jgi:glycine/D-amino acid oxidase-like deaminating enzyme
VNETDHFDTTVIGGGFYGARLALMLRARGQRVLLIEREPGLLGRASLRNQARVHGGYHYPRSMLTSLRSRLNYARFVAEYSECVDQSFRHYYAIARGTSKVTAAQFAEFCRRIGAPAVSAQPEVVKLFDASRIEAVFEVQECAFDAVKLRERIARELTEASVETLVDTEAVRVVQRDASRAFVLLRHRDKGHDEWMVSADLILNCTYSRTNHLLEASGVPSIPAKHELTELALVVPPPALQGAAVTVMDGPFFSLMPYPSRGLFSFSHVRYTPHCTWNDVRGAPIANGDLALAARASRYNHMVRDAARYLGAMRTTRYVESLWETKTLMPRSEQDDSRPILLSRSVECPSCVTVVGAKIDSVYDGEDALASTLSPVSVPRHEVAHAG